MARACVTLAGNNINIRITGLSADSTVTEYAESAGTTFAPPASPVDGAGNFPAANVSSGLVLPHSGPIHLTLTGTARDGQRAVFDFTLA